MALATEFFFFFQAEDGIRDLTVTGVQTCALPIWHGQEGGSAQGKRQRAKAGKRLRGEEESSHGENGHRRMPPASTAGARKHGHAASTNGRWRQRRRKVLAGSARRVARCRSEERRVGKECRSRWAPDH